MSDETFTCPFCNGEYPIVYDHTRTDVLGRPVCDECAAALTRPKELEAWLFQQVAQRIDKEILGTRRWWGRGKSMLSLNDGWYHKQRDKDGTS